MFGLPHMNQQDRGRGKCSYLLNDDQCTIPTVFLSYQLDKIVEQIKDCQSIE